MRAVDEEGAHGGDVAIGGSKVQQGGAGQTNDGRGGVPMPVRVVVGHTQGVDVCAVVYEEVDDEAIPLRQRV